MRRFGGGRADANGCSPLGDLSGLAVIGSTLQRMPSSRPLFVYGTLKDPELRRRLLGEVAEIRPAELRGYAASQARDGWQTLVESPQGVVAGELLTLSDEQLWSCDQWEEIPMYQRRKVSVTSAGVAVDAWAFVHKFPGRIPEFVSAPLEGDDAFVNRTANADVVRCDLYILAPVATQDVVDFNTPHSPNGTDPASVLNGPASVLRGIVEREFTPSISGKLDHVDGVPVRLGSDDPSVKESAFAGVLWAFHRGGRIGCVVFQLPACSLPVRAVLEWGQTGKLAIDGLRLDVWLGKRNFRASAPPRFAVFLPERAPADLVRDILSCETPFARAELTAPKLVDAAKRDLSQYSSAQIYASERCLVEIGDGLAYRWEARFRHRHALTLFLLEMIAMQEAAIHVANQAVEAALISPAKSSRDDLSTLEAETRRLGAVHHLLDVQHIRFVVAQHLAQGITEASRIDAQVVRYHESRALLSEVLEVRASRLAAHEADLLNAVLLFLTVVQATALFIDSPKHGAAACLLGVLVLAAFPRVQALFARARTPA